MSYPPDLIKRLQTHAYTIRRHSLIMTTRAASGHPSSSLSMAEIMAALYFHELRVDPRCPDWPERDRFVLSKGHGCPAQFAALAERGFFDRRELLTLRQLGSFLQGHPDLKTPGVEAATGSLGNGISIAVGMALAGKLDRRPWRVYTVIGDGECQEGMVWEAAMAAAHFRLDNLCALLDFNGLETDGPVREIMNPEPLDDKFRAFGWHVVEVDGHDLVQILDALAEARRTAGRPTMIIAHTVKGKGVSFMEHELDWHGKPASPEQLRQALAELDAWAAAAGLEPPPPLDGEA